MYAKIEPSGCGESHGNVQIRLAFYLEPADVRYEDQHVYIVDETCPIWLAGYKGKVDEQGSPVDQAAYDAWVDTCLHKWQVNPFHNHFINADPDVTDKEIKALAVFHLANFYKAWCQGWDKIPGGMRVGWAKEHRIRPLRYEEVDEPQIFALRKLQCEQKAEAIKVLNLSVKEVI